MILYNVTISVDGEIRTEWLEWMRGEHIPDVLKTGFFKECKLCRLLGGEEQGGKTYAIMYLAFDEKGLGEYQTKFAPGLQNEHNTRFGGKFAAFRTELEVIEEFKL
jgi:hypothetical protein